MLLATKCSDPYIHLLGQGREGWAGSQETPKTGFLLRDFSYLLRQPDYLLFIPIKVT